MIYQMALDLEANLQELKFPIHVHYGPERTEREGYDDVIVMERDRQGQDVVLAPRGQQRNPRHVRDRQLACVATIFAVSTKGGAHVGDHEDLCERYVDAFVAALYDWGVASRAGDIAVTSAKYLDKSQRADTETWPGVAYEIRFRVPRGVTRKDFDGAGLKQGLISSTTTTTKVSVDGGTPETV